MLSGRTWCWLIVHHCAWNVAGSYSNQQCCRDSPGQADNTQIRPKWKLLGYPAACDQEQQLQDSTACQLERVAADGIRYA